MSSLLSWAPLVLVFLGAFLVVSLVALFAYWFSRWNVLWAKIISFVFASLVCLGAMHLFLRVCATDAAIYTLPVVGVVAGFCAAQAWVERARAPQEGTWKQQFALSFVRLLCSVVLSAVPLLFARLNWLGALPGNAPFWSLLYGALTGTLFAPLSISFYRWMLPNLRLRPGLDRSLKREERDEEVTLR